MIKCVDCGIEINDKCVPLCYECYEARLLEKIREDDRVVESPHASWF